MALWDNSGIATNEQAMLFNQMWQLKSVDAARNHNGLYYAIVGKQEPGSTPLGGPLFERLQRISGDKVELRLLGKLAAISTVADGSAEVATATLTHVADKWGAQEFELTHYADAEPIPSHEYHRFVGDEAKTLNYIDEFMDERLMSFEDTLGTAINGTDDPTRTEHGGWVQAIDDGTDFATYGTIDRSAAGNADFQSYVSRNVNELTLPKIRTVKNNVIANNGRVSLGVCETAVYGKVQQLVEGYTQITYDEEWSAFGGEWVKTFGIRWILDQRAPGDMIGFFDPSTWRMYDRDINFTQAAIVRDVSRVATHVLNWESWRQLLCKRGKSNGKMTDITV